MGRSDLPGAVLFSLHPDQAAARQAAKGLFEQVERELKAVLPPSADVRHVGATAVPGCLTKGDLDIVVRVAAEAFAEADRALAARFARNEGSKRTDSFSAFEDASATPHLGVQLTVAGGKEDFFHLFVDALTACPQLLDRYNSLKRSFDGQLMVEYRQAKDAFVLAVLARTRAD